MSAPTTVSPASARVVRARNGTALTFVMGGISLATLASRAPAIKHDLGLSPAGLGLLLMCLSLGSVSSLLFTGPVVQVLGNKRGVMLGACLESLGFSGVALGLFLGSVPTCSIGMVCIGLGVSVWDVSMNVEAAAIERAMRRTMMPRFHAGFSLGTVIGAAAGTLAAALSVPADLNLAVIAVLALVLGLLGASAFLPRTAFAPTHETRRKGAVREAWTNPRTLVLGVMLLAFAFTEGVANDWTAVSVVDGLDVPDAVGALMFGVFVASMTTGRLFGGAALDRWGRVRVLRGSAVVAGVGVVLVATGPVLAAVAAGSVLWGLGAALGFPTAMSAAADNRATAAVQVAVVSTLGYVAFLAGPPIVGFLGNQFGVRPSLLVVLVALGVAFVTAAAARPVVAAGHGVTAAGASDRDQARRVG